MRAPLGLDCLWLCFLWLSPQAFVFRRSATYVPVVIATAIIFRRSATYVLVAIATGYYISSLRDLRSCGYRHRLLYFVAPRLLICFSREAVLCNSLWR